MRNNVYIHKGNIIKGQKSYILCIWIVLATFYIYYLIQSKMLNFVQGSERMSFKVHGKYNNKTQLQLCIVLHYS